ncbi:CST complex subunit STN1-like [Hetaerina americana]|uniref:CST complex subunit STN1-like n=1 Tax=Hetaerina americana TaxID=62018 RepID=UPI003A7F4C82
MGCVTEVKEYPKFMVISVDDGTGVISCLQNLDHMELFDGKEREMKEESRVIWKYVLRETPVPFHANKGDTIHAQGTISEYRGKKELRVEKINVNEEIHRTFELELLYRNIYDLSQ